MYDGDTTDQPMFTQVAGDCTRAPAAPDDVLHRLTSEQVKATMPDPKSRSKGKDISSLAPQSNRQKTRDSSRTPRERRDASKKRKLAVNDELSKSPAHSQREKDDASIDATEDVAHSPDVSNPRDDQLTEVLSDEYDSEDAIIRTRDKEEKFGPSRMFGLTNVVQTSRNSVPPES
ncbi:hypothetical protein Tco_0039628 [Tanacetum coccineum]